MSDSGLTPQPLKKMNVEEKSMDIFNIVSINKHDLKQENLPELQLLTGDPIQCSCRTGNLAPPTHFGTTAPTPNVARIKRGTFSKCRWSRMVFG